MKEPNVHVIEAAKILKVDRTQIPALMKKHGIPVTASFKQGRGSAYFYDRTQVEQLATKLASPPAPNPMDVLTELVAEVRDLKALINGLYEADATGGKARKAVVSSVNGHGR